MDERTVLDLCWGCQYSLMDDAGHLCVYREQCVSRGSVRIR